MIFMVSDKKNAWRLHFWQTCIFTDIFERPAFRHFQFKIPDFTTEKEAIRYVKKCDSNFNELNIYLIGII